MKRSTFSWVVTACGGAGLLASLALTIEHVHALGDPEYRAVCDISPIVSCTSVLSTTQGNAFGFPNSLLGIAAFSVVATLGVLLLGQVRLPIFVWRGLQVGVTVGVLAVLWLFAESLYRIGSMCPYCIVTWIVTITLFWYVSLYNLAVGHLPVPARLEPAIRLVRTMHSTGLTLVFVILAVLVVVRFWDHWLA